MLLGSDFVEYMDEANERASMELDQRDAARKALGIPAPKPFFTISRAAQRRLASQQGAAPGEPSEGSAQG